jgi:hypothetical protein
MKNQYNNSNKYKKYYQKNKEINKLWLYNNLHIKCQKCNYNYYRNAIQCHHLNKRNDLNTFQYSEKPDNFIKDITYLINNKEIIWLCANCHQALHANEWDISELKLTS